MKKLLLIIVSLLIPLSFALGQKSHKEVDSFSSEVQKNCKFGSSITSYGNYAAVSTIFNNEENSNTEAVYIYKLNENASWVELAKKSAGDNLGKIMYGNALAMTDEFLFVSAYEYTQDSKKYGAIYVYQKDLEGTDNWKLLKKILPPDGKSGIRFGYSIDAYEDKLVVGAPWDDEMAVNSGVAYIYYKDEGGDNNWGLKKIKYASQNGDNFCFGESVSLYGDHVIVGSPGYTDESVVSGAAFIFRKNKGGADSWSEVLKLEADSPVDGQKFGFSVDINDEIAVASAPHDNEYGNKAGKVFIFAKNATDPNVWDYQKYIKGGDTGIFHNFGHKIILDKNRLYVSNKKSNEGSVYVFERHLGFSNSWKQYSSYSESTQDFGCSFAINDKYLFVSQPYDDVVAVAGGSVKIYKSIQRAYLKHDGSGDGSSWDNASSDLQSAMEQIYYNGGGEVWMANGTYMARSVSDIHGNKTYLPYKMYKGVKVYGGFPASGTPKFIDRETKNLKTIISGDINDDGKPSNGDVNQLFKNPKSSVGYEKIDTTSVLDGIVLENIYGGNSSVDGGLMYTVGGKFNNCIFRKADSYRYGAAINVNLGSSNTDTTLIIRKCTFSESKSSESILVISGYGAMLDSLLIENNDMYNTGGWNTGNPILTLNNNTLMNSTIRNNKAMAARLSSASMKNCIISNNTEVSYCGGVNLSYNSSMEDCYISGNTGKYGGGAIVGSGGCFVNRCIFKNNTATNGGGVYSSNRGKVYNSLIISNSAINGGGGDGAEFYNCTIVNNSADEKGGGLSGYSKAYSTVIWGNYAEQGNSQTDLKDPTNLYYCAVQNYDGNSDKVLNIASENSGDDKDKLYPWFTDPDNNDFSISSNKSALIDAGYKNQFIKFEHDMAMNQRVFENKIVDIGAFEFQGYAAADAIEITVNAGDGGSVNPITVSVLKGEQQQFKILPNEHFVINTVLFNGENVIDNLQQEETGYSYTTPELQENSELTITFTAVEYEVSLTKNGEGNISGINGNKFTHDDEIELSLTPDTGYELKSVTINGIDITGQLTETNGVYKYTITEITKNTNVEVEFSLINYTVTINANNGGSVSPEGSQRVTIEDVKEISITPDKNFEVVSVTINGEDAMDELTGSGSAYTLVLTNISENKTIDIQFDVKAATDDLISSSENNLEICPNPVKDKFKIKSDLLNFEAEVRVFSINGNLLVDERNYKGDHIDVSILSEGVYIIHIKYNGRIMVGKLVKQ